MAKILALLVIALVYVIVNVQGQATNKKPVIGQTFDEIVVSSDLNVRRKLKENLRSKKLTNVPSGTTGPPEKTTELFASRLVSSDGSRIAQGKRKRRETPKKRLLDLEAAEYMLKSRKRRDLDAIISKETKPQATMFK